MMSKFEQVHYAILLFGHMWATKGSLVYVVLEIVFTDETVATQSALRDYRSNKHYQYVRDDVEHFLLVADTLLDQP